jgi:hypothetical protein
MSVGQKYFSAMATEKIEVTKSRHWKLDSGAEISPAGD